MIEYRIKINKDLLATMFIGGNKGLVVYASGLPQYAQKQHAFVSQILEAGYSLCIPRYYGTWESEGEFNVSSSVKTLEETLDFVKNGECNELYSGNTIKWSVNKIILLGYSFGALPALKCNTDNIFGTLLVCPFISSKFQTGGEDINTTLEFIKSAYPRVYKFDLETILNEFRDTSELPEKKEKMVVVRGLADKAITDETYDFLASKYGTKPLLEDMGHSVIFKASYFDSVMDSSRSRSS